MIIKRNDFTTYLESHISKEQNQVLQSVPGFRVKYINLLSVLTELMERDYHWTNNKQWQSEFYELVPDTFKKHYEEKLSLRFKMNFSTQFRNLPSEWVYNYTCILNEMFFDFIKTNKHADFFNLEYLVKMIENILKIAKFKIDDF